MRLRFWLGAGLIAVVARPVAFAQSGPDDAGRNWAAIAECAAIDATEARHRCMDDVIRRAGLLDAARVERATRQEFGKTEAPRPARRADPSPAAAPAAPVPGRAPEPAQASVIDELVTTIASVRTVGYQRLRVTTREGAIWDQAHDESFPVSPKVGDAFAVERGALGSYRCRFGQSRRYRCQRVD